jgi:uncharacterized repeat protein (TIGR03803 family)
MKHFVTILAFCALTCSPAFSQSEGILHTFTGGSDGGIPVSGVIADSLGALYGTAIITNTVEDGLVYKLNPPVGGGTWTQTILYTFTDGLDGSMPESNLIFDSAGNLYGTTIKGGANGCGTFYELTAGTWAETTLFNFPCGPSYQGSNSAWAGNIVLNPATGIFYGVAQSGGSFGGGWVYELAPVGTSWNYSVLYQFNKNTKAPGYVNGCSPISLVLGPGTGDLFGTALYCGYVVNPPFVGSGTVFRLSPNPKHTWNFSLIHSFPAENYLGQVPDGATPYGLAIGKGGVLYGGAAAGGSSELGLVYSLAQAGPSEPWTFSILYSFTGGQNGDGSDPISGVVVGNNGVLYGATAGGGSTGTGLCGTYAGCGTIFELSETNGLWTETVLHSFADNGVDGENPNWGALLLRAGDLYGMTTQGGADNDGVVYAFHP